jgi:hypothetical protein
MGKNSSFGRICKKGVVGYFKVFSFLKYSKRGEDNQRKPQIE